MARWPVEKTTHHPIPEEASLAPASFIARRSARIGAHSRGAAVAARAAGGSYSCARESSSFDRWPVEVRPVRQSDTCAQSRAAPSAHEPSVGLDRAQKPRRPDARRHLEKPFVHVSPHVHRVEWGSNGPACSVRPACRASSKLQCLAFGKIKTISPAPALARSARVAVLDSGNAAATTGDRAPDMRA